MREPAGVGTCKCMAVFTPAITLESFLIHFHALKLAGRPAYGRAFLIKIIILTVGQLTLAVSWQTGPQGDRKASPGYGADEPRMFNDVGRNNFTSEFNPCNTAMLEKTYFCYIEFYNCALNVVNRWLYFFAVLLSPVLDGFQ